MIEISKLGVDVSSNLVEDVLASGTIRDEALGLGRSGDLSTQECSRVHLELHLRQGATSFREDQACFGKESEGRKRTKERNVAGDKKNGTENRTRWARRRRQSWARSQTPRGHPMLEYRWCPGGTIKNVRWNTQACGIVQTKTVVMSKPPLTFLERFLRGWSSMSSLSWIDLRLRPRFCMLSTNKSEKKKESNTNNKTPLLKRTKQTRFNKHTHRKQTTLVADEEEDEEDDDDDDDEEGM